MGMEIGIRVPPPTALKLWGENSSNFGVVAPTGFEPVFSHHHVFAQFYCSLLDARPHR